MHDITLNARLTTLENQMRGLVEYYNNLNEEAKACQRNMLILQGRIEEVKAMLVSDDDGDQTTTPVA